MAWHGMANSRVEAHLAQEQLYRLEAERVATQAQKSPSPKIKQALLEIADQYQQLANSIKHAPLI